MSESRDESRDTHNPRTNGWECPWHPLQVLAWGVVIFFTICHYGFLVYYFPSYWRVIGYTVPSVLFLIYLLSTVITTSLDPAESNVRAKLKGRTPTTRGRFDPAVHDHVIEDLHCHLCDVNVHPNTKHCRLCDKCIYGFDHHCKWLNTCIGARNYKWFMVSITTAFIATLFNVALTLILFVLFFADRDSLRYSCNRPFNVTSCDSRLKVFGAPVPDPVFPALDGLIGLMSAVGCALLGHLTLFHYYLIYKGISTYDYIMRQRADEEREKRERNGQSRHCCKLRSSSNRVKPLSLHGQDEEEEERVDDDENYLKESTTESTSTSSSINSAGKVTFGRTPPPSDSEDEIHVHVISANEEYINLDGEATPTQTTPTLVTVQVHDTSTELKVLPNLNSPPTTLINSDTSPKLHHSRMLLPPISTHASFTHSLNEFSTDSAHLLSNNN